jgi:hypothetical protein
MDNYYIDKVEIALLKGKLMDPIRADKPYQTIATEDIGAFAALAFSCPRDFVGLELEIAGSELTNPQAAQVFSPRKTGQVPEAANADGPAGSRQGIYQMFHWFNADGFRANIPELRRSYPEVRLQTLEEWLRAEGWHKRARRIVPPKA